MLWSTLKTRDISNNSFTSLPIELQHLDRFQAVFTADNPITCNCDMLWLINWTKKVLPDGTRIVHDYEKVKCSNIDKQIYKLTAVEMGCFPMNFMANSNSWSRWWNHNIGCDSSDSGGQKNERMNE